MTNYPDSLRRYITLCATCVESLTEGERAHIDGEHPLGTRPLHCAFCGTPYDGVEFSGTGSPHREADREGGAPAGAA